MKISKFNKTEKNTLFLILGIITLAYILDANKNTDNRDSNRIGDLYYPRNMN